MGSPVEVCSIADIGIEIAGDGAPPLIVAINEYLSVFVRPAKGEDEDNSSSGPDCCFKCGTELSGWLGSFQWGMASGEGRCGRCKWPARAHHYPKDADGNIFDQPIVRILQYRPDYIDVKDKA